MIKLHRRASRRGEPGSPARRAKLRAVAARDGGGAADLGTRELDPQILAQLRELQDWAARSRTAAPGTKEEQEPGSGAAGQAWADRAPMQASADEPPPAVAAYREATPDFAPMRAAAAALQNEAPEAPAPETPEREPRAVESATSGPPAARRPRSPDRADYADRADRADRSQARGASSEPSGRRLAPGALTLPSRRPGGARARRPARWPAALAALLLVTGLAGYLHRAAPRQAAPARAAARAGQADPRAGRGATTAAVGAGSASTPGLEGGGIVAGSGAVAPASGENVAPATGEMPSGTSPPAEIQPQAALPRAVFSSPPAGPADTAGSPDSGGFAARPPSEPLPSEPALSTPPRKAPARHLPSPAARARPLNHLAASEPAGRHAGLLHAGPGVRPPALLVVPALKVSGLPHRHHAAARLQSANHLRTLERIELDVLVNDAGYVARAEVRRGDTSRVGLDRAALKAAKAARFRPATRNGVPGSMWTRLSFDFKD